MAKEHSFPERSDNLEALMQAPKEKLKNTVKKLTDGWRIQPVALPQAGLGLLKLEDGAFHEPFFLGEFPLATAHLSVTSSGGESVEGAAVMMTDDIAHVQALAICDAILSHELAGCDEVRQLLAEGQALRRQETKKRQAMLAATRVNFSLLADVGVHDED